MTLGDSRMEVIFWKWIYYSSVLINELLLCVKLLPCEDVNKGLLISDEIFNSLLELYSWSSLFCSYIGWIYSWTTSNIDFLSLLPLTFSLAMGGDV